MKPAIIKGWDYPKEDFIGAHESNKLVKLLLELSNVCNLSCPGCFTKRVEGSWSERGKSRLPGEMSFEDQLYLLDEAAGLGVKTVDIVGAGEPTLDPKFTSMIEEINRRGMYSAVFTHGVSGKLERPEEWKERDVSFFFKLWSMNPDLQDRYVAGSIPRYSDRRTQLLFRYLGAGFNEGAEVEIDGIPYRTTRLGADILVMRSNLHEIPTLFRFCRNLSVMPEIKSYIPEGPTRFDQEANRKIYDERQLEQLRRDEVPPSDFWKLREELERIDREEYGNLLNIRWIS